MHQQALNLSECALAALRCNGRVPILRMNRRITIAAELYNPVASNTTILGIFYNIGVLLMRLLVLLELLFDTRFLKLFEL